MSIANAKCGVFEIVSNCLPESFDDQSVRWIHQALPEPKYPYAMLAVGPITTIGTNTKESKFIALNPPDKSIEIKTTELRSMTVSLSVHLDECTGGLDWHSDATSTLENLSKCIRSEKNKEILCLYNFSIVEIFPIIDISTFINTEAINSAMIDFTISFTCSYIEFVANIESVNIQPVQCIPSAIGGNAIPVPKV